jgi:hypothetical protein
MPGQLQGAGQSLRLIFINGLCGIRGRGPGKSCGIPHVGRAPAACRLLSDLPAAARFIHKNAAGIEEDLEARRGKTKTMTLHG